MRMRFNQDEWVNEIVTGAVTGVVGGLVSGLFVPEAPWSGAIVAGGVVGLVTGLLIQPLKWLLNRIRGGASEPGKESRS
jgi:hypothetical protein